jgi:hypothetical protein
MLATLCVGSSLALVALGSSDPTGRFCLRTLSFAAPSAIVGPIWNMVSVSHAIVVGVMCEEFGRHVNMVYHTPY